MALNVCLYGRDTRRWTMTERGRRAQQRTAHEYRLGPSRLQWDGRALTVEIDEIAVPIPRRVRGRVTVTPSSLCRYVTALDVAGRHRWGPIGPVSRVEVEFDRPGLRWQGHAYLDSNEGDEPIDTPFVEWDWSRATLADGSTAVIYDVRNKRGPDRVIAARFGADGTVASFTAPPRQPLPRTLWGLGRTMRSDADAPPRVAESLEDTPFYARAVLESGLLGERVTSVHETLVLPRLVSWPVQRMLPFRMPRRA